MPSARIVLPIARRNRRPFSASSAWSMFLSEKWVLFSGTCFARSLRLPLLVQRAGLVFGSPSRHPHPHRRRAASLVLNFGARSMLRVTEVQKLSG
jgi:hypothetical protein